MLQVLDTGFDTASGNMLLDAKLLENLKIDSDPILHLYQWSRPSATFGHFIQPEKYLNLEACGQENLDMARRSTGGGITFHIWDLAFSFLMPASHPKFSENTLANYHFVNSVVIEVVKDYFNESAALISESEQAKGPDCQNFCMARPTQYDVVYQGRKVAGAAQRRKKQGYLHQGTIALARPDFSFLKKVLLNTEDVLTAMMDYSFAPLETIEAQTRTDVQQLLAAKFHKAIEG